jgi:hypothetical protein
MEDATVEPRFIMQKSFPAVIPWPKNRSPFISSIRTHVLVPFE